MKNNKLQIPRIKFRVPPRKKLPFCSLLPVIAFLLFSLFFTRKIHAQEEIGLTEAVQLSKGNFYLLENKKLEIEQEKALKIAAYDFGETSIFTGGEELGNGNPGVYTNIGIQQQGIDLFGIFSKNKFHKAKMELAKKKYDLSELELEEKVKSAWTKAFIARRKYRLFTELDSIYKQFRNAASLKYEVEAISHLEFLVSKNKSNQINMQKKQSYADYMNALRAFNLWLGSEKKYDVPTEIPSVAFLEIESLLKPDFKNHPLMQVAAQRMKVAEAKEKVAKAAFLPELNLQYGFQEINEGSGFYKYEIGISVPFLSGEALGNAKAAKIEKDILRRETEFKKQLVENLFQEAVQNYRKWKSLWEHYQTTALALAEEQRAGSLLAYREGGMDYTTFIQNLNNAISIENEALNALEHYLKALFELQFYLNTK